MWSLIGMIARMSSGMGTRTQLRQTLTVWLRVLVWIWTLGGSGHAMRLVAADSTPWQIGIGHRRVLYQQSVSAGLSNVVSQFLNPKATRPRDSELPTRPEFFFRLCEARWIVDDRSQLRPGAQLGGGPYVFLTVPEGGFHRTLYGIYSDLGYDAESVLEQEGLTMVAVVFRYPDRFKFSSDGAEVRSPEWHSYIYRPLWPTAFELFAQLAGERRGDDYLNFPKLSEQERNMVRFFPTHRRQVISTLPYSLLRSAGGADWDYRLLLEQYMSMNSHFLGVGFTENTLSPADDRKGLPEFVGPNLALTNLAECVVIDLGRMEFLEVHHHEAK